MRLYLFLAAVVALVVVTECRHTFLGTNVQRPRVFYKNVKYGSYMFQRRLEEFKFSMPKKFYGKTIQGILAYDKARSRAKVNVTDGGLGFDFVTLRLKSERGLEINYDLYIYG